VVSSYLDNTDYTYKQVFVCERCHYSCLKCDKHSISTPVSPVLAIDGCKGCKDISTEEPFTTWRYGSAFCDIYDAGKEANCNQADGFKVETVLGASNDDPNGLHEKIKSCLCDGTSSFNFLTGGPLKKKCASSCDITLHKFYTVSWFNINDLTAVNRGKFVTFTCQANSCPESSKIDGAKCYSYIGGRTPQI